MGNAVEDKANKVVKAVLGQSMPPGTAGAIPTIPVPTPVDPGGQKGKNQTARGHPTLKDGVCFGPRAPVSRKSGITLSSLPRLDFRIVLFCYRFPKNPF